MTFPHPSPPSVLAVSRHSNILITASARPAVIYVHNLQRLTAPPMIHPQASATPVTSAAFHPERNNVFLLCFMDGTIALYLIPHQFGEFDAKPLQDHFAGSHNFEVSCFKRLHKTADVGIVNDPSSRSVSERDANKNELTKARSGGPIHAVAGAAFIPGYRSRAISVGADGKCRLIDFENGGKLLRTWHIGASATCLSILCLDGAKPVREPPRRRSDGQKLKNKDYLIAIGRVDGVVMLYDSVGLLLQERIVNEERSKVISIEWCPDYNMGVMPEADNCPSESTIIDIPTPEQVLHNTLSRRPSGMPNKDGLEKQPSDKKTHTAIVDTYGDQFKTVITKSVDAPELSGPGIGPSGNIVDLFSSAKKTIRQRKPFRIRPRLSSSTYRRHSQTIDKTANDSMNENAVKGCRRSFLAQCQRLALDGQASERRAAAESCEEPAEELPKKNYLGFGQHNMERTYNMPGSYFSSDSSLNSDTDSDAGEISRVSQNAQAEANKLNVPRRNGNSLGSFTSSPTSSDDPREIDAYTNSSSGVSTSSLGEASNDQVGLQRPKIEVAGKTCPITDSDANIEESLEYRRSGVVVDGRWASWKNQTNSPKSPFPPLTAENLLQKQGLIPRTSSDQPAPVTGFSSVTRMHPRYDEIASWAETKSPANLGRRYESGCSNALTGLKEDYVTKTKHIKCPSGGVYCAYVEKELQQLQTRMKILVDKVNDIHHLVGACFEDESRLSE